MTTEIIIKDPVVLKIDAVNKFRSGAQLASFLGVTRQCVNGWGELVPPLYAYRLIQIYPDLMKESASV